MAASQDMQIAIHRVVMFVLGGAMALALWMLGENWDNPALSPALYLALFSFVAVFSAVTLALAGPVPTPRAVGGGLISAILITVLISLAGRRHETATDLLADPVTMSVAGLLLVFSTPFLSVWLQDRHAWRRYDALFDAAWTMVVRFFVAWVFVAVFWLVVFLSDALLTLVDVTIIDRLLSTDWAWFALTGGVLGLGLAVVHELRQKISPYLVLRLTRLLVPVVLVVVALFLAAVPFRGLSQLFGDFSAATTLMGSAIAAIVLISIALDRSDEHAVSTRGIRAATMALAVLLPLLTGLAVWAVALRVRQYGWTPDRVLAATAAGFLLAYGLGYCASVLARRGWGARIRKVNVVLALLVIVVSMAWMTPVLNPYRISTNNQVARFQAGKSTLDQLALWQMAQEWGRAGQAGLERLEAMRDHPDYTNLAARIDEARTSPNLYRFEQAAEHRAAPERAAELAALMALRPAGDPLSADAFAEVPAFRMQQWLEGCRRALPDGRAGCVLIRGRFLPVVDAADQGIVLYLDANGRARANHLLIGSDGGMAVREVFDPVADRWPTLEAETVARALDGGFEIRPSGGNALFIGDAVLVPGN